MISDMPQKEKAGLFKAWREEINNIYDKNVPSTNIGRRIYKNCMRFNLKKESFVTMLDSAELNALKPLIAPNDKVFEKYIYGIAIVPVDLSLKIMGESKDSIRQELAKNLGTAMLITSILRDIKTDAHSNRIYFPAEILEKSGVVIDLPLSMAEDRNIIKAREELAKTAEKNFKKAERMLDKMSRKQYLPLRFINNISRCYFNKMQARGWEIISPKPKIGFWEKLNIVRKTLFS
jgi:phytoene synthase